MYTKDTTKPKSWKKTVIAALTGMACVAIGAQLFDSFQDQEKQSIDVLERYTQTLVDHGDYNANQIQTIDNLIKEGVENMQATAESAIDSADVYIELAAAKTNKKSDILKEKGRPAVEAGQKQLEGNVKWGNKSGKDTVDPKKIQQTFADSAKFQAEIAQMFPESYKRISAHRQDLKILHFELMNQIKDVELLATSTKDNLRRSIRKLDLRKKFIEGEGLKASTDEKIWKFEIKQQVNDLTNSQERCNEIIAVLRTLQKNCAKTQDNIENELQILKVELKRQIDRAKVKIDQMEKEMKAAKCSWWQAILTLGIACIKADKAKAQLREVQSKFKAQLDVSKKLQGKMFYFDGMVKTASMLTAEATGLLEVTKKLENRLGDAKRELEQDFNDTEIDDNLWDEDFANDFAERCYEALDRVARQCDETIKDTKERKARLEKALIWGDL